jgi:hypothetical protein
MKALPFLLLALLAGPAMAQSQATPSSAASSGEAQAQAGADRELVRSCNRQVKQKKLKGQEKRAFLKNCRGDGSNATSAGTKPPQPALQTTRP